MSIAPNRPQFDVFLSYSHEDTTVAAQVVEQLENAGFGVWWDRSLLAGDDWIKQLQIKLDQCRKVIVLWSKGAEKSKHVYREASYAYARGKLIAFSLDPLSWPGEFSQVHTPLWADVAIDQTWMSKLLGPAPRALDKAARPGADTKISITGLPLSSSRLIGRRAELEMLKRAWKSGADPDATKKTNVVSLIGLGGSGKTALLRGFLDELQAERWAGAKHVFAWSAYSQGSHENSPVSADAFLHSALKWFGFEIDKRPLNSSEEKAAKLAEILQQRRTLLILDGIEPLQHLTTVHRGRLKDRGLQTLIENLGRSNPGLLLITSRQPVIELDDLPLPRALQHDLKKLDKETGAALLVSLGVRGRAEELEQLVKRVAGHALCITLLGTYLDAVHAGDLANASAAIGEIFNPETADDISELGVRSARRVMDAYLHRFSALTASEARGQGRPERSLLAVMGLFDRPVDAGALAALAKVDPPIAEVTEGFVGASPQLLAVALRRLRSLGLFLPPDPDHPGVVDAHPLVREFFGETIKMRHPASWRAAHRTLYEHYRAAPKDHHPNTLDEMEPLFKAVRHGCLAGLQNDAWSKVYVARIIRGESFFLTKALGAFGADLAALSAFFATPWNPDTVTLPDDHKRQLLNMSGFQLRAIGRLAEAKPLLTRSAELAVAAGHHRDAANSYGLLSEAELLSGRVHAAIEAGQRAFESAEKTGEAGSQTRRIVRTASLARVLHQGGNIEGATRLFKDAENLQRKQHPASVQLHGLSGYYFCDLLLDIKDRQAVANRAAVSLQKADSPLARSLARLAAARAASKAGPTQRLLKVRDVAASLTEIVEDFRRLGNQEFVVEALLTRAEFSGARGEFARSDRDIEEVDKTARRCEMKLAIIDALIVKARMLAARLADPERLKGAKGFFAIFTRQGAKDETNQIKTRLPAAIEGLQEAQSLVLDSQYRRRLTEVEDLLQMLRRADAA